MEAKKKKLITGLAIGTAALIATVSLILIFGKKIQGAIGGNVGGDEPPHITDLRNAIIETKLITVNVDNAINMAKKKLTQAEIERFSAVLRKIRYLKDNPAQSTATEMSALNNELLQIINKIKS